MTVHAFSKEDICMEFELFSYFQEQQQLA